MENSSLTGTFVHEPSEQERAASVLSPLIQEKLSSNASSPSHKGARIDLYNSGEPTEQVACTTKDEKQVSGSCEEASGSCEGVGGSCDGVGGSGQGEEGETTKGSQMAESASDCGAETSKDLGEYACLSEPQVQCELEKSNPEEKDSSVANHVPVQANKQSVKCPVSVEPDEQVPASQKDKDAVDSTCVQADEQCTECPMELESHSQDIEGATPYQTQDSEISENMQVEDTKRDTPSEHVADSAESVPVKLADFPTPPEPDVAMEMGECSSSAADSVSVSENGTESSRDATPTAGEVVTDRMVEEEMRLREGGSREGSMESESERGEVQKLKGMVEQQRFLRLQHLLKQSNIYSKFLLKRMEEQREKQEEQDKLKREKQHRRKVVKSKKGAPQVSPGVGRVTRLSLKSPSIILQSPSVPAKKGKGGGAKRGRKRKADEDGNFKISDFMDNQGKLKQMKLNCGKAVETDKEKPKTLSSPLISPEEDEVERYFNGQLVPYNQPKLVTGGIMRSYQLEGVEWIKSLYENGVNGILGDEMGLGKTLQCIAFIAYMIEMGVRGPFLVAAPLSTVSNWVAEFKKFTPKIPVVLYHGTATEREDIRRKMFAGTRVNRYRARNKKQQQPSASKKTEDEPFLPVVVTSYEICMRDQQYLENRHWKFLVVDEGHRIKNLNCKLIRALKQYDASNRLLLTGTPLQNNLAELWSLLNFLLPNIFNDLNSFQSWFDFDTSGEDEVRERIIAQEREQHVLGTLHQILTPFLLRRLKTDVEFSLPPKKEILVYAPLTLYQEKYYKSLLDKTIFEMMEEEKKKLRGVKDGSSSPVGDEKGEEGEGGGAGRGRKTRSARNNKVSKYSELDDEDFESLLKGEKGLEELCPELCPTPAEQKTVKLSATNIKMTSVFMMLRKCCNHPYLLEFPLTEAGEFKVDEQIVSCCGKIMLLDRMLPALIKQGHKTLIFSQFTSMLDILEDYLELRGLVYGRLDGSMAFPERERQMTMFRESPDCMIFLLSTRAGGLGINLTSADTVIIYDSDWNPQADLQAQDRCHRIGQTQPVMVYRLVTANTIDQRIVERAATKRRLEKIVIHKGKFKGVSTTYDLSVDDLVDLLNSVDHEKVVNSSDAVISDDALSALLDRAMQTNSENKPDPCFKEDEKPADSLKSASSVAHAGLFKVIAERDSSGKLIGGADVEGESSGEASELRSPSSGEVEVAKGGTEEKAGMIEQGGVDQGGVAPSGEGGMNKSCNGDVDKDCDVDSLSLPDSATPEPISSEITGSLRSSSATSFTSTSSSVGTSTGASEGDTATMEVDTTLLADATVSLSDGTGGREEGGEAPANIASPRAVTMASK